MIWLRGWAPLSRLQNKRNMSRDLNAFKRTHLISKLYGGNWGKRSFFFSYFLWFILNVEWISWLFNGGLPAVKCGRKIRLYYVVCADPRWKRIMRGILSALHISNYEENPSFLLVHCRHSQLFRLTPTHPEEGSRRRGQGRWGVGTSAFFFSFLWTQS